MCKGTKCAALWSAGLENCSAPIVIYNVVKQQIISSNKATKLLEIEKLNPTTPLHMDISEGQMIKGIVNMAKIKSSSSVEDVELKQVPQDTFGNFHTRETTHPINVVRLPCSLTLLANGKHRDCEEPNLLLELSVPPYYSGRAQDCFMDYTSDGFWDWYPECDYEYMSPGFWKMFGYDPEVMPHKPSAWQKIIHPEDLKKCFTGFDAHIKSHGEKKFFERVRYQHKDGHCVTVICRGTVVEWLPNSNRPWRIVGTHTDISGTLWMQTSRVRDKLIAQLSHDLKTPLCVLMAICDKQFKNNDGICDKKQLKKSTETWEPDNGCFEMALQHLVELTNDLQYFSNDESSSAIGYNNTARADQIDLRNLFLRTCKCIQLYANMVNSSISASVDPGVPRYVCMPQGALSRLIYNLGSNAVRHGTTNCKISISLCLETNQSENKDDGKGEMLSSGEKGPEEHETPTSPHEKVLVKLVVSTVGMQLSESTVEKLEKTIAFWHEMKSARIDTSFNFESPGSDSLGVSIIYGLLNSMEGDMKIAINENEGVEWVCYIPMLVVKEPNLKSTAVSSAKIGFLEDYIFRSIASDDHSAAESSSIADSKKFNDSCGEKRKAEQGYCQRSISEGNAAKLLRSDREGGTRLQKSSSETNVMTGHKPSVLVVEDEPIVSKLLRRWLISNNWDCVVAANGTEALRTSRQVDVINFDFVLLDLRMPDMNGIEFLQYLKSEGRPRSLEKSHIIVTSSCITDSTWERLYGLGAEARLDKPYHYKGLLQYLTNLLASSNSQ